MVVQVVVVIHLVLEAQEIHLQLLLAQGNNGGTSGPGGGGDAGGGGGGATAAGGSLQLYNHCGGPGGNGATSSINGFGTTREVVVVSGGGPSWSRSRCRWNRWLVVAGAGLIVKQQELMEQLILVVEVVVETNINKKLEVEMVVQE